MKALFAACSVLYLILPAAAEWELLDVEPGAIQGRHEAEYVAIEDSFYLLGGRGKRALNIYDPATDSWSVGAQPEVSLHHFQALEYEGELWLAGGFVGGYPDEKPYSHILIYSPEKDEWRKGPEIARPRGGSGFVLHEGLMYLVSGITNGHIDGHVKWLDRLDPKTGKWTELDDCPQARDHFRSVVIDGKIYNAAGRRTEKDSEEGVFGNLVAEVDVYDIVSGTWSSLPEESNIPTPRAGNMAVAAQGKLIIAGGESLASSPAHREVEALDPESQEWTALAPMVQGRHGAGLIYYKGKFYVASGSGRRGGGPELTTHECCAWPAE